MSGKDLKSGITKSSTGKGKWPKIVGISIGGVMGLLAIVILLLPNIISSNIAKKRIVNFLKTNLNREVQIGDINMSWSGGLDIKNIFIKERDDFLGDTFVKVDRILCDIEFIPLIRRQIRIRSLVIESPEIVLQRDEGGVFNYEDIGAPAEVTQPPEIVEKRIDKVVEKPVKNLKYAPLALPFIDIELKANINNGKFTFIDHRLREETIIKDFDTTLNVESMDKPIELKSTFNIEAKGETERADISLNVSLAKDGEFDPGNAKGIFNMKTGFARMVADFDMARFRGKGGTGLDFLMNVDLKEFTEKLAGILGLPEGLRMEGVINSKITAEGQLDKIIGIDGITEIVNLNIYGGPLGHKPIKEPKIRLAQNVDIDMVNNDVEIHGIDMESNFANMELTGSVTDFRNTRNLDLKILLNCDMTKLLTEIGGLLPEDTEIAGKIESNIKLQGRQEELKINGKTNLRELLVKKGSIGPISEPEIQIIHDAKFNLQHNSFEIEDLNVETSFMQVKSSGALSRNREIDLDMYLVVSDVKKLMHNLKGIVTLPQGLSVSGKVAGEINAKGSIEKEIKLSGKTILYGVNATGGPLEDASISNLDLKLIHTLEYNKPGDYVNIEQMDVVSDFLDMSSKGKITDLTKEKNIDYELSMNMELDKAAILFAELLPANMTMAGKGLIDLGINGQLSTKDDLPAGTTLSGWYESVNLNGNISIDTIYYDTNKITDLKSGLHLDDGLFTTKDFNFKLNEGQGKVLAKANLKEDKPTLDLDLNLSDVGINQKLDTFAYIIPDLSTSAGQISGMLNMTLTAQGKGLNWQDELSKSLNAQGDINIKNGYIKGDKIISRLIKKEEYKFDDITTDFRINDEKIYTDDLKVNGEDFDVGLSGWAAFDGRIEYTADAEKILGRFGKGTKLPVVITGTINNPKLAFKMPEPQEFGSLLKGFLEKRYDLKQEAEEAKEPSAEKPIVEEKEEKTAETHQESQPQENKKEDIVEKFLKSLFK